MSAIAGGIIGAIAGGLFGYDAGVKAGYAQGYNQAKWEMEQQMAAMRAEFADQIRQLQAQVNEMGRNGMATNNRLDNIEGLLNRLLSTLQAEATTP